MYEFECLDCDIIFSAPFFYDENPACTLCGNADTVIEATSYLDANDDWDSFVLASVGWGTDEDYGYYGE